MTRTYHGLPTYTFANDPLPPAGTQPRGQADIQQPAEFVPTATVRLGDTQFTITERVDGSTPWHKTGNTDFEHFLAAISRSLPPGGPSPLAGEARDLYQVLSDAGLSRFAAAMLWHEKKNDTWRDTPIPAWMHNPFSTRDRSRPGEWEQFDSYADAARAWVARVNKDPYPQNGSIQDFVNTYAPGFENDVPRYVAVLTEEINALPVENALPAAPKGKAISIPGLSRPVFVPEDLVVEVQLIPPGHTNNRPGLPMTPETYTQHDTDNVNEGMGAAAHSRWLDNGAEGAADTQVGVHAFVDDKKVIIKTPFNEVQWHAGDSGGPGNMGSISCELCVNSDRDVARAERNAAVFAAAVIRDGLQTGIETLEPHQHWSGKNCPRSLLPRWDDYVRTVGNLISEGGIPAPSFPGLPSSMPVEVLLALFPDANPTGPVTRFYIDYCVNHMPPGQWPRFNGFKDLSDGTRWWDFNPLHMFSDPEGHVWTAGEEKGSSSPATPGPSAQGDLAFGADLHRMPARDFGVKDAAMAHDRQRHLAVTTSEADLLSAPGGETMHVVPVGTHLTVLGDAEDGLVPVVVSGDGQEQGYVRADEIADATDAEINAALAARSQQMKPGKRKPSERKQNGHKTHRDEPNGHKAEGRKSEGRKTHPEGPKTPPDPETHPTGSGPVPASGSSDRGGRIAAEAEQYVGYPYVWATHGPNSFDCSGLVHWAILQATGENVSPDSHAQFNSGTPVEWDQLRPGDIVFYDPQHGAEVREGNNASHVGIFVRDGQMVNALNEQSGVVMSDPFSDYFKPLYLGARRLV